MRKLNSIDGVWNLNFCQFNDFIRLMEWEAKEEEKATKRRK